MIVTTTERLCQEASLFEVVCDLFVLALVATVDVFDVILGAFQKVFQLHHVIRFLDLALRKLFGFLFLHGFGCHDFECGRVQIYGFVVHGTLAIGDIGVHHVLLAPKDYFVVRHVEAFCSLEHIYDTFHQLLLALANFRSI